MFCEFFLGVSGTPREPRKKWGACAAPAAVGNAGERRRPDGAYRFSSLKGNRKQGHPHLYFPGTATVPLWGKELGPQSPDPHPATAWLS